MAEVRFRISKPVIERPHGYAIGLRDEVSPQLDDVIGLLGRRPLDDVSRAQLTAVLSQTREDYAVLDLEPDGRYPVESPAAPVFDADGEVVLAVTLDGLPDEPSGRDIAEVAADLTGATRTITRRLGGRVPGPAWSAR